MGDVADEVTFREFREDIYDLDGNLVERDALWIAAEVDARAEIGGIVGWRVLVPAGRDAYPQALEHYRTLAKECALAELERVRERTLA